MTHIVKKLVVVVLASAAAFHSTYAQGTPAGVIISGKVTSDAGAPIPGTNVFIQGMSLGTQTGLDGHYSFTVPAERATGKSATLIARVISYTAKSAAITLTPGTTVTQDFTLAANPLRLGEVVVTGAGTSTVRDRLTTTINTVDSAQIRRAMHPENIVSALAAQAPNVVVRTQTGDPGSSASIHIRGTSSLTGTGEPLFVVDGQPIDNSTEETNPFGSAVAATSSTVAPNRAADINPSDIESVEILKGAAAAAIYGARAANGVVLITTKRGQAGQTRYTLSSSNSFDRADLGNLALQTKYGQGSGGVGPTPGCGTVFPNCTSRSFGPLLSAGTPIYNHLDELFDTGHTSDNYLAASGGDDRTVFYASGGYYRQDGDVIGPNNAYTRATVRLKASQQVQKSLNLGGNFSYTDARGRYLWKGNSGSGLLLGALRTSPDFNNAEYLDPNSGLQRTFQFPNPVAGTDTITRGYDNPFWVANNQVGRSELGRFIANMNADWNPLEWLAVHYTLGADSYNDSRLEGFPQSSSGFFGTFWNAGDVIRSENNYLQVDHNLVATADHELSEHITGVFSVGQNLNARRQRELYNEGTQLIAPYPFVLQNTLITGSPLEVRDVAHIEGYFAQEELTFYKQLILNVGIRNDGFSTFGSSNRRANYPKASLAWNFVRKAGDLKGLDWINYGKLRFAYGETGKEPPYYAAVNAFTNTYGFGSGFGDVISTSQSGQGGLTSSDLTGNPNLKPERSRETEGGFDLSFFGQRLDLSTTVYNKRSTDVILPVVVNAAQTGGITAYENAASISNKGTEITLNARPYTSKNVDVDLGIQYGRNKGNVLSLAGAQSLSANGNVEGFHGALGSNTVGYAPGIIRGFDFVRCGAGAHVPVAGVGPVGSVVDVDALCSDENASAGALFLDANGLPIADPTERVIADPHPKYTMSYNASVRLFGKLQLSTLFDVRKGGEVVNATRASLYRSGTAAGTLVRDMADAVFGSNYLTNLYPVVAGPGKGVAAIGTDENSSIDWETWFTSLGGLNGPTAQFVEDGSFVKWRELSVTYTLDLARLSPRLGFRTADLRIAGRNLHTWTKYSGMDPEADLGGAEWLTSGIDYFNTPQTRSLVLSVSLNR